MNLFLNSFVHALIHSEQNLNFDAVLKREVLSFNSTYTNLIREGSLWEGSF